MGNPQGTLYHATEMLAMSTLIAAPITIPRKLNQSIGRWLVNKNVVHMHNGMSLHLKKRIIHRKMDEPENHIKQDSPDSERQVLHIFCCMWTLAFNVSCVCMYFQMCVCTCDFSHVCIFSRCLCVCMHLCA